MSRATSSTSTAFDRSSYSGDGENSTAELEQAESGAAAVAKPVAGPASGEDHATASAPVSVASTGGGLAAGNSENETAARRP